MNPTTPHSMPAAVAAAIAAGVNAVKAIREARGYSIDDMAVTCGLSVSEIVEIESGGDANPDRLRRIAAVFRLPETLLTGS